MNKKQKRYVLAPGPDVDLEKEDVRDSRGNRITESYVDEAVAHVHAQQERRRRGRPSLSGGSKHSPTVSFRVPEDVKELAEERAKAEGKTVSQMARDLFLHHLAS